MDRLVIWFITFLMTLIPSYAHGYTPSKSFYKSQVRNTGAVNFTSSISTSDSGYLVSVAVNFSVAPTSNETVTLSLRTRNASSTSFDQVLAKTTALAGATTSITFIVGDVIPVGTGDQVNVQVTNNSTNGTVFVSGLVGGDVRSGSGMSVYRDGVLISSRFTVPRKSYVAVSLDNGGVGQAVVTDAAWVNEATEIVCSPRTPDSNYDIGMEYTLAGLSWVVSDLRWGVGFTLSVASSENERGLYVFSCIGLT